MRFPILLLTLLAVSFQMNAQITKESPDINTTEQTNTQETQKPIEEAPKSFFDQVSEGNLESVKKMLRDSVDYYAHTKEGETALTLAIKNDDIDMVKVLVKDAVINLKNKEGETPLTLAIKRGNYEIIRLVCRRAKGALKNNYGETPLYLAVESHDLYLVEELIQKGADINRKSNGITPLAHATELNNFKAAGYMIKEGADINLPNDNGDIPLFIAVDNGFDVIAGMLINKSHDPEKDVNWRTKIDETLINIAIVKSHPEIVKILINFGANVTSLDYFDNSALHIAAEAGNNEIVSILLQNGVDINLRNLKGETPIMLAAKAGNKNTIEFMVKNGANPDLKDYQGYSVRQNYDIGHLKPAEEQPTSLTNVRKMKGVNYEKGEASSNTIFIDNN